MTFGKLELFKEPLIKDLQSQAHYLKFGPVLPSKTQQETGRPNPIQIFLVMQGQCTWTSSEMLKPYSLRTFTSTLHSFSKHFCINTPTRTQIKRATRCPSLMANLSSVSTQKDAVLEQNVSTQSGNRPVQVFPVVNFLMLVRFQLL